MVSRSPSACSSSSGDAPTTSKVGRPHEEQVRARVDATERAVQPDPVERGAGRDVRGQAERLASGEHHLDGFAAGDGVLGDFDRVDVGVATQAGLDRRPEAAGGDGRAATARRGRWSEFGGARPGRPLQGAEDRLLGDPVATLEVGGVGVQRGDRRQGVEQVVEDDDEVGLDERGGRDADRVAVGQRDGRLEEGDGVVREGTDGAAGEPRHAVHRLDAATRDERAEGGQRVVGGDRLDRQVRGEVGDRDRPGLDAGLAVADLQEAPRPDAEERVATGPLAAFDGLEQVRRAAVVEAQEGADGRLEVSRPGGPQQDRVGAGGQPLGLGQADRIGGGHRAVVDLENQETTCSSRDERSCLPRCHPHSACAALS